MPPLLRDQLVHEPHDNDFSQARLSVDGHGAWGAVAVSATYLLHNFTSRYDASPVLPSFGASGLGAFDETKDIDLTTLEATYASPNGQTLSWLVGAYVSRGRTNYSGAIKRLTPAIGQVYDETRTDSVTETAIYGDLTLNLTDSFSLSAGVRVFQYRFDTLSNIQEVAGSRQFSGSDCDTGFSPKIVFAYEPLDAVIVYAEAAGGYRGGGFNTSGRAFQPFDGSVDHVTREYSPDTIWNYEIGAKLASPDRSVRVRVAAFFDRWRDLQSDQFQLSGLPFTSNVGDGIVRGLELEANWSVTDEVRLGLSALLQDSDLIRAEAAIGIVPPKTGLPGTPDLSASATFDFHRPLDFGPQLHILGSITYIGHSFLTFAPDRVFDEGGYATASLSAALEFNGYKIAAFVNNLTDSSANTFAFGNPFRMRTDPEVTPLQPRTIGVELSASF